MRVGVNTLFMIPKEVGGTETYLREVLRHCIDHPDITWVLFTNAENQGYFQALFRDHKRVEVRDLGFRAANRFVRIFREQTDLPRKAREARVDLLWSPGYTAPLHAACPQVVCVFDMQYREFPQDLTWLARLVTGWLVPAAVRRCNGVVTTSRFSRQQILKYVRVPAHRVHVIHAGVDPAFGLPLPASATSGTVRRLVPAGVPYVLCVANTYPHKNVSALIQAFGKVATDSELRLVLVGKPGQGEAAVQEALQQLKDPQRVTRLDWLSREELIALYQGARIFAFPSLYEGFGLPVLEAMTARVPVLAAARAAVPEIGGEGVWYFDGTARDLEDQLRRMLGLTEAERSALIERASGIAARFTWQATADETIRYLLEIHAEHGKSERKSGAQGR